MLCDHVVYCVQKAIESFEKFSWKMVRKLL